MRSGGAAGAPAEADFLAAFHGVSFLHFEFRKMKIKGKQSLAVVDDYAVSFKIEKAREEHCAIVHGGHWGARVDSEVEAPVGALRDSVEDALRTEDVGGGGIDWSREVATPLEFGRDATEVI